jgi:phosphoglycolate phosphatase-like HAD superfamily hydrolase
VIRAAVFDFDGVVLESADIKTRAFAQLFDGNEAAVAYHLEHAGVSRYDKFRHISVEILGVAYSEEDEHRLGRRFSELVLEEVLRCPFVPGARELLERRSDDARLFVASGTPEEELREIVRARGLAGWLTGVHGTPSTKGEILARILRERELEPHEMIFVGDAMTDLLGAREASVPFVGRVPDSGMSPFLGERIHVVRDMAELDQQWDALAESPPPVP